MEVTFDAKLSYLAYGDQDPIPFEASYFEWKKPNGWNFIGTNQNAAHIKFLTDLCAEGYVEVRGRSSCGKWSEWEKVFVSRYAQAPCPVSSTSSYVVCENQTPISVVATPDNTLTGYTYEWEKPIGWTWEVIPGSGSTSVSVKPDGLTGGVVRVRSIACGKTSAWCTIPIPLKIIHPDSRILGTDTLCADGYQTISIPPPPNSEITWNIIPPGPFEPYASGVGDFANLQLNSSTYGDFVTITFNVATQCGDTSISKKFFAGKPKIYDQRIDGNPGFQAYLCPGSHWVSAKSAGAGEPCFYWQVYGNNPYFTACNTVDVFMTGYSGSAAINANVSNICGSNDAWFFLTPKHWGCESSSLNIYPNPANSFIVIAVSENGEGDKPVMDWIKMTNDKGNLVREITAESTQSQIDLSDVPNGLYTISASIGGTIYSEYVQVLKD